MSFSHSPLLDIHHAGVLSNTAGMWVTKESAGDKGWARVVGQRDGKSVSGRCYCGPSEWQELPNKGAKGQSEVERSTLTPREPTQRGRSAGGGVSGGLGRGGNRLWEVTERKDGGRSEVRAELGNV